MSDTPPYSEATVEAAAQAGFESERARVFGPGCGPSWDEVDEVHRVWARDSARAVLDALAAAGHLLPEEAEQRTDYGVEFAYPGHDPKTLLEPSLWVAEQTVALGAVGHAHAERRLMQRTSWSTPWSAVPPEPKEGT